MFFGTFRRQAIPVAFLLIEVNELIFEKVKIILLRVGTCYVIKGLKIFS